MGAEKLFLGLDFGTSGARACVIDSDRHVILEARAGYPDTDVSAPHHWRAALYSLLGSLPPDIGARLFGLAMDATSGTVLLCDDNLDPVSPALLYNDPRAKLQAAQLESIAPEGHCVCTVTSGLAKFLWLMQQHGSEHAVYFMHQADWLTALLSGRPGLSDYHNALKTGYDVERLCWPDWVMSLPYAHLLPEVLAPGEIIGEIRPDIATRFGINPRCLIHAGTTDSTAAFMAADVNEIGVGVTTLGTTLTLKQLSTKRIEAPEYGVYSHRYGGLWLAGGASNAGAGILRRYFDDAQLALLSARIDPLQETSLDYYPLARAGERFPISDPQLAPRLEPRPADDAQFLHGMLQGLARIETAGYARLAGLGAPPLVRVVSSGGGARNETWRKIREKLLGVPVSTAAHSEAAYGSALLCADPKSCNGPVKK